LLKTIFFCFSKQDNNLFSKRVYEHIRSIEPSVRFSEVKFKEFSERVSKQLIEDAEKQKHKLETLVRTVERHWKKFSVRGVRGCCP
jgi:hypothetical protein